MLKTNMYFKKITLLVILLVALGINSALAQTESYIQTITGVIKPDTFCKVNDEKFANAKLWSSIKALDKVQNLITFEIRLDTTTEFINKPFTAEVLLDVTYLDSSNVENTINDVKLTVQYDTTKGKTYNGIAYYKFEGGHNVTLKVKSISSKEIDVTKAAFFRIKNQIFVERTYKKREGNINAPILTKELKPSSGNTNDLTGGTIINGGRQMQLTWIPSEFEWDKFDLEYTFYDFKSKLAIESLTPGVFSTTLIADAFKNNATRVSLDQPNYLINLVFPKGYLLVRIRAYTYNLVDGEWDREEGAWHYLADNTGINGYAIYLIDEHVTIDGTKTIALNWQYSAAFAEEGKRKEVVSYFDGGSKSRQSVTISNSDNVSIVAESVLDKQNRPAVSILPVPVNENTIHFFPAFNKNTGGQVYSYADFNPNNSCASNALAMNTNFGASKYYSPNNTWVNDELTKDVPDANGFPFAVTEFTHDQTGRIRRQGGVGTTFQIGGGHETSYYYGKPSQQELDRLFGSEAGAAAHYSKNMVVDANGQVSVSYVDIAGKTVATSLAGNVPQNLKGLTSEANAGYTITDELIRPQAIVRDAANLKLNFNTTILVPTAANYNFKYEFSGRTLELLFGFNPAKQVCADCYYDVKFSISDDCNNPVTLTYNGTNYNELLVPATFNYGNNAPNNPNTSCGIVVPTQLGNIMAAFTKTGEYKVNYELVLSRKALDFYMEYIKQAAVTKTKDDYKKEYLKKIDLTGCFSDCRDCIQKLGTEAEFIARMIKILKEVDDIDVTTDDIENFIKPLYNATLVSCSQSVSKNCTITDGCSEYRKMMLKDVTPGGQYMLYDQTTLLFKERAINVFLKAKADTRNCNPNDPNNSPPYFIIDGVPKCIKDMEESEFLSNWDNEWAYLLLYYHPEYCLLAECEQQNASKIRDRQMMQIDDYGPNIGAAAEPFLWNNDNYDAFINKEFTYILDNPYNADNVKNNILARFNNFFEQPIVVRQSNGQPYDPNNSNTYQTVTRTITLKEFIKYSVYCPENLKAKENPITNKMDFIPLAGVPQNITCVEALKEWRIFRNLYIAIKQAAYRAPNAKLAGNNCGNCYIGVNMFSSLYDEKADPLYYPQPKDFIIEPNSGNNGLQVRYDKEGDINNRCDVYVYKADNISGTVTAVEVLKAEYQENGVKIFQIPGSSVDNIDLYFVEHVNNNYNYNLIPPSNTNCPKIEDFEVTRLGNKRDFSVKYIGKYPLLNKAKFTLKLKRSYALCGATSGGCYMYKNVEFDPLEKQKTVFGDGKKRTHPGHNTHTMIIDLCVATPASCISDSRWPLYFQKTRRFYESSTTDDINTVLQEDDGTGIGGNTGNSAQENAETLAVGWMEKLKGCTSAGDPARKEELKQRLIAVCVAGTDILHPYGSSTTKDDKPTSYGDKSFKDAIEWYLQTPETPTCNAFLIDFPVPYGGMGILNDNGTDKLKECGYILLTRFKAEWLAAGGAGNPLYPNLTTYIKKQYDTNFYLTDKQIDDLIESYTTGCPLKKPIRIPSMLTRCDNPQTPTCLKCSQLYNVEQQFQQEYPQFPPTLPNYYELLAAYINRVYSMNVPPTGVYTAIEKCKKDGTYTNDCNTGNNYCNKVIASLGNFYQVMPLSDYTARITCNPAACSTIVAEYKAHITTWLNITLGWNHTFEYYNINYFTGCASAAYQNLSCSSSLNEAQKNNSIIASSSQSLNPGCNDWLQLPNTSSNFDQVNIGDLDVTGNQITVEAKFTASVINGKNLVTKKLIGSVDVNYQLSIGEAGITTTNGFASISNTSCSYLPNKTYHVAMVYNGSSLKYYQNGFLIAEVPATGNLVNNDFTAAIGNHGGSGGPVLPHFTGYINEVRIWNVARSQSEIQTYMNASLPNPTTQTGLLGYYIFNDLLNKQGNPVFNGTLYGNAQINATNSNCTFTPTPCYNPCTPCTPYTISCFDNYQPFTKFRELYPNPVDPRLLAHFFQMRRTTLCYPTNLPNIAHTEPYNVLTNYFDNLLGNVIPIGCPSNISGGFTSEATTQTNKQLTSKLVNPITPANLTDCNDDDDDNQDDPPRPTYYIYGKVWHDVNGMSDGYVNNSGTSYIPPAISIPTNLKAYLVNEATGFILSISDVNTSNGAYGFSNITCDGLFSIHISSQIATIGSLPPSTSLPSLWEHTGQKLGIDPGNDGVNDGIISLTLLPIPAGTTETITNANFGIRIAQSGNCCSPLWNFTYKTTKEPCKDIYDPTFLPGDFVLCSQPLSPIYQSDPDACIKSTVKATLENAEYAYNEYIKNFMRDYREAYFAKCMSITPSLLMTGDQKEYHYTLYYYDQAGNLVKTVPPKGVTFLTPTQIQEAGRLRDEDNGDCYQNATAPVFANTATHQVAVPTSFYPNHNDGALTVEQWVKFDNTNTKQIIVNQFDNTGEAGSKAGYYAYIENGKLHFAIYGRSKETWVRKDISWLYSTPLFPNVTAHSYIPSAPFTRIKQFKAICNTEYLITANAGTNNGYYHIVFQYSGNPNEPYPVKIFVNGVLQTLDWTAPGNGVSNAFTDGLVDVPSTEVPTIMAIKYEPVSVEIPFATASNTNLVVGAINRTVDGHTAQGVQGRIKHLRIYNAAPDAADLRRNSFDGCFIPAAKDGLVLWLPLNKEITTGYVEDILSGSNVPITATWDNPAQPQYPHHNLPTYYAYNSLNQVVHQETPDAGQSNFWYDRLGRLVVSQNAEQKTATNSTYNNRFSYTLYDTEGRITEVGEKIQTTDIATINTRDPQALETWLAQGTDRQITKTIYDAPDVNVTLDPQILAEQQRHFNSRKRVVTSLYQEEKGMGNDYNYASHYIYDISGNVKRLYQDNRKLPNGTNVYTTKTLDYEFDLISGKVNNVWYQKDKQDQYLYRYYYDADNRVVDAQSGRDELTLRHDARYQYYKHGPLGRTELAHDITQGVDYAYTLQGWLKGINGVFLNEKNVTTGFDLGRDGVPSTSRANIPADVYGYTLGYYNNDYTPINPRGGTHPITVKQFGFNDPTIPANTNNTGNQLFNGNIAYTSYANRVLGTSLNPNSYSYQYDQLNRILKMRSHNPFDLSTPWSSTTTQDDYAEDVSYDANGNILTYLRKGFTGNANGINMDNLVYHYQNPNNNNKLDYVEDDIANNSNYAEDIDNQAAGNYEYDKIGNLIADHGGSLTEKIDDIQWTVYGKIRSIAKQDGSLIEYAYDPGGNRISKTVTKSGGDPVTTYYFRDATGNTMAVYEQVANNNWTWKEQNLYGSSRLGMWNANVVMDGTIPVPYDATAIGSRHYELTNHLGNVLATVSDKKLLALPNNGCQPGTYVDILNVYTRGTEAEYKARIEINFLPNDFASNNNDNFVAYVDPNLPVCVPLPPAGSYYIAEVITAQDYYPFGMNLPGRRYTVASGYRYGFNGQERSTEINDNSFTAEFWQYDARLSRRWNIDPVYKHSPYEAFGGNPIWLNDQNGRDTIPASYDVSKSIRENLDAMYQESVERYKVASSKAIIYNNEQKKKPLFNFTAAITLGFGGTVRGKILGIGASGNLSVGGEMDLIGVRDNQGILFGTNQETGEKPRKALSFGGNIGGFGASIEGERDANTSNIMNGDNGTIPGGGLLKKTTKIEAPFKVWEQVEYINNKTQKVVKTTGGTKTPIISIKAAAIIGVELTVELNDRNIIVPTMPVKFDPTRVPADETRLKPIIPVKFN